MQENMNSLTFLRWCYAAHINPNKLTPEQKRVFMEEWRKGIDPSEYLT